jgi:ketosteroid isomerase-like protein
MTKRFWLSCLFASIVLLAGVPRAAPQEHSPGSADHQAAVRHVLSGLSAADNAGNLDAVVRHYRDDAMLLPPNADAVAGRPAIRDWYEKRFRQFQFMVSFDAEEIEASGDRAFARGYINGRLNPKAVGAPIKLHEKFIMVLRRDKEGWKIARLIWNSDEVALAAAK